MWVASIEHASSTPTGVVYILDLGLVVPLMLLAGRWPRQRRPFGYVAAAILVGYLDNGHSDGPPWALIALGSLLVLVRYLQPLRDRAVGLRTGPEDRPTNRGPFGPCPGPARGRH